ncbi:uncharacterized protein LOC111701859 [Eurytemora carolleeae]|uniref:uncharacterized protein LOC111701859 n=1 Tax=Eurytemora carolleeae TaxID=1294199 RepID=UPI000C77D204|nr:uncharacterized protein LOC111701859 [Eurytemora carolleeae]|eukprot:XP_023329091.1 uncharacterized protein LOC111701859 [Eurytemora affinis]
MSRPLLVHGCRLLNQTSVHDWYKPVLFTLGQIQGSCTAFSTTKRGEYSTKPGKAYTSTIGKPVITIPVTVEKRAMKRHKNIKNISRDQDKQKLKNKPLAISCKRSELNHYMGQTYGKFDKVPLASQGWNNRNMQLSNLIRIIIC